MAEDGREYYANVIQREGFQCNEWIKANVLPHQGPDDWYTKDEIQGQIMSFCDSEKYGAPEFWGYYAAYDWVVLCQLFGDMGALPSTWPMYIRDLRQELDSVGSPVRQPDNQPHHALDDARWIARTWNRNVAWAPDGTWMALSSESEPFDREPVSSDREAIS